MDASWNLKNHLACTLVELTLGHVRWMRGEIWKVILRAPCMRTLLLDVTSSMSQGQMMKICKIFPLNTFQMSSCMDVRWHLKSHLACTSHKNFGVVQLTLGHTRWMRGEIWKVILHAPWFSWHSVILDGCEVKSEKSSCMHLMWELWCGGADTWSH